MPCFFAVIRAAGENDGLGGFCKNNGMRVTLSLFFAFINNILRKGK